MDKWKNIDEKLLDRLNLEWEKTRNPNTYIAAKFIEQYPEFQSEYVGRGGPNKKNYVLKKSLYDRLINKLMTNNHNHTGKKKLAQKMLNRIIDQRCLKYGLSRSHFLILLAVKSVPNNIVRRLKFGSGHLTRAVKLTVLKKWSWFLGTMAMLAKKHKLAGLGLEMDDIMAESPKSKMLTLKKQCNTEAEKANIQ